ncbi:MAG: hypothetical protein OEZ41_12690 [Nitrospirota bacterium]|nr:hypothetical protein [Nitrospirota bacterium]MDH5700803.1 hypothetical protein [Nitrospirota bacterium]
MWRKILLLVVVAVFGYVSNAFSQAACLENAVFWYSQVMMSGQPYYVVLKPGQEQIRHALDTVKAPYTVLPSPPDPDAYPRVRIYTTSWVPFLISEHFYSEGDETRRAEFTAHYLGLFGMALSVGDSFDIPSMSIPDSLPAS